MYVLSWLQNTQAVSLGKEASALSEFGELLANFAACATKENSNNLKSVGLIEKVKFCLNLWDNLSLPYLSGEELLD